MHESETQHWQQEVLKELRRIFKAIEESNQIAASQLAAYKYNTAVDRP